ncbi:hypothetical protein F4083_09110 [Candidatus Poribacteria bacterium]|nr:hypothetical protein [Candidatus Poribacteria bacterium]MYI94463.1 hypothetical protein [Candidatus Poribacteria bacterium]
MSNQHKVYVSYHPEDQFFREHFKDLFSETYGVIISDSIRMENYKMGDFDDTKISKERIRRHIRDNYLRDTTVTVVLIGANTWQQESVDWEINASLHQTEFYTRSGLLGILIPTYITPWDKCYIPTIPLRLYDNVVYGYSKIYPWYDEPDVLLSWIRYAHLRRIEVQPINSRLPLRNNLSDKR